MVIGGTTTSIDVCLVVRNKWFLRHHGGIWAEDGELTSFIFAHSKVYI